MKNRDYRTFSSGEYYHVFNRGTGKMDIFISREDHLFFLTRIKEALFPDIKRGRYNPVIIPEGSFELVCYCLMPNHFHLLIKQNGDIPVSKIMNKVCTSYSKYFNKKYDRVGSLFQDQFKAVLIETNEQLLWLSVYIHKNPLVAGIASDLKSFEYSSYPDYIGIRAHTLCNKEIITGQISLIDYQKGAESDTEGHLLYPEVTLDAEGALL
jgi:putative transposase